MAYTAKGNDTIYAIYMPTKDENQLPSEILIKTHFSEKLKATLLTSNQKLIWKPVNQGIEVKIPQNLRFALANQEAVVIKISR